MCVCVCPKPTALPLRLLPQNHISATSLNYLRPQQNQLVTVARGVCSFNTLSGWINLFEVDYTHRTRLKRLLKQKKAHSTLKIYILLTSIDIQVYIVISLFSTI